MKLSRKWLSEFVTVDANDREFAEAMTLSGSKVEVTEDLGAEIENVVVGKVLTMKRHENSDHMWVCQVDAGKGEPIQIVTGAQNVREGDIVPVALHKSLLPGGKKIEKGKLRGEISNGMLCSFAELGLEQRDFPTACEDGIWILSDDPELTDLTIGGDIRTAVGLDDHVVDFEITPNRPDCLSVIGLAREASATFKTPLRLHQPVVKGGGPGVLTELLDVETPDPELCARYTGRMVRNVKIAPSPKWMRERLRAMGVRPINNIVDITNYVMLEYGQPMHAFDYRYVKGGKIVVRRAREGEELTTLDGNVRKLTPNMLVIADETRAVGLAGIMGGENSEIVDDTADVVFESANFDGTCIRKAALSLGMRTEASAKFEKGLDPLNTLPAVNRACELVELLGAGEVVDGVIDVLNHVPQPRTITMDPARVNALLGTDIHPADMYCYLERVEIHTEKRDFPNGPAQVSIPSWRSDVEGIADLAEEVARLHGYNNIPATLMRGETTRGGYTPAQQAERRLGAVCRACGYSEIITYSFISPSCYDKIRWAPGEPLRQSLRILNPLGEDTSIMRTTTLPSMLEVLARNVNYRNRAARLYEVGKIYLPGGPGGLANEPRMLTLGAYGEDMDFFVVKGAVEALLKELRVKDVTFEAYGEDPSYHPGRCAAVRAGEDWLGVVGQIHPLTAAAYGVEEDLYCAELSFDTLLAHQGPGVEYAPLPRFPAAARDIAVVCREEITVGALEACIRRAGGKLLREAALFDIYRGRGVAAGSKSVAFSLTLRADDRSITAGEADEEVKTILAALETELGAVLR